MLCARVLRGHHEGEQKKQMWLLRVFERAFDLWLKSYEWALDRVLAYKSIMLMVTFATIAGTVWLYIAIPKGFFPQEDTGFMLAITEAQADISFDAMSERQRKVAEIIRQDPAVLYVNSTVGVGGPNSSLNNGRMLVALKPKHERGPLSEVIPRLRRAGQPGHRHGRVLPDDPEHQRRRPDQQEPVSVHAAIERHRDALQARAGTARQDCQGSRACST